MFAHGRIVERIALAHQCRRRKEASDFFDPAQFRQEIEVEQDRWRDDAHVEHGAERLATRQNAHVFAVLDQNGQRLLEGIGAHIFEGC